MMSEFLVISTSLNADSNSRILARKAFEFLEEKHQVEWLDLRDFALPQCDGDAAYAHPDVKTVSAKIEAVKCVIMAVPIYNYAAGSPAKNLIELTGKAWTDKLVGFLCAAGGKHSYMAVLGLANSLMLDFRCWIIPRFVYADGSAFDGEAIDSNVAERIKELTTTAARLSQTALSRV
ncbi:MAG TPA: NAD(P)H-dependent oxidoreductase [Candidatus Obscuribacterales bacterium]